MYAGSRIVVYRMGTQKWEKENERTSEIEKCHHQVDRERKTHKEMLLMRHYSWYEVFVLERAYVRN